MHPNTKPCSVCSGAMALRTVDPMEAEDGGVRMRIEAMPAMCCSAGHRRLVTPDFPVRLIDGILAGERLVPLDPAVQKGLLRKRNCCPRCGAELEPRADNPVPARRAVALPGLDTFAVSVELPRLRCNACSTDYVPPVEVIVDHMMKASAHAFRSAALSPA